MALESLLFSVLADVKPRRTWPQWELCWRPEFAASGRFPPGTIFAASSLERISEQQHTSVVRTSPHRGGKPDIWMKDQWPTSSGTEVWRTELVPHWLYGRVQAMVEAFLGPF